LNDGAATAVAPEAPPPIDGADIPAEDLELAKAF